MPDRLDPGRVFAHHQGSDLPQEGGYRAVGDGARVGRDLAPARYALVGVHLDKDKLSGAGRPSLGRPRTVVPFRIDYPRVIFMLSSSDVVLTGRSLR